VVISPLAITILRSFLFNDQPFIPFNDHFFALISPLTITILRSFLPLNDQLFCGYFAPNQIQWSRDRFERIFAHKPLEVNTYIYHYQQQQQQQQQEEEEEKQQQQQQQEQQQQGSEEENNSSSSNSHVITSLSYNESDPLSIASARRVIKQLGNCPFTIRDVVSILFKILKCLGIIVKMGGRIFFVKMGGRVILKFFGIIVL